MFKYQSQRIHIQNNSYCKLYTNRRYLYSIVGIYTIQHLYNVYCNSKKNIISALIINILYLKLPTMYYNVGYVIYF